MSELTRRSKTPKAVEVDGRIENCIIKLGHGELSAMEELYLLTSKAVFAFALSFLHNGADAEDAMHDTYIAAFKAATDYQPQKKPIAWLIGIAKKVCLMRLREIRMHPNLPLEGDVLDALPSLGKIPSDEALILRASLGKLTEEENRIVILYAVAGFKHREIAGFMKIPLSTELSKYRRAISKLRKMMEEENS